MNVYFFASANAGQIYFVREHMYAYIAPDLITRLFVPYTSGVRHRRATHILAVSKSAPSPPLPKRIVGYTWHDAVRLSVSETSLTYVSSERADGQRKRMNSEEEGKESRGKKNDRTYGKSTVNFDRENT